MDRMAIYVMRMVSWLYSNIVDFTVYFVSLSFSVTTVWVIMNILVTEEIILPLNSTLIILILYVLIFLFSIVYYSFYAYFRFSKYTRKELIEFTLLIVVLAVVLRVPKWLGIYELGRNSQLELSLQFMMVLTISVFFIFLISLFTGWLLGHRIKTHFKFACSAIGRLEESQNYGVSNYKNIYTINSVSEEYNSGINEIKNLLIRGIDLEGVFDSNTELSLNEILDWLTFSMQYYLFYGGPEQMGAVKNHLERMRKNFNKKYYINSKQFMDDILIMYNKMDIYFKENNIYIERSIKFTDRIMSHLPQVLLAIALLVISVITKDLILN